MTRGLTISYNPNETVDKEKIFTIAIGLAVGILAASGYFLVTKGVPNLTKVNPIQIIQPKNKPNPSVPPTHNGKQTPLSLDLPIDNSSTQNKTATVSGQTAPNATVVIYANADQNIASAAADGKFKYQIQLENGLNVISVTAMDGTNTPNVIYRNVTLEIPQ